MSRSQTCLRALGWAQRYMGRGTASSSSASSSMCGSARAASTALRAIGSCNPAALAVHLMTSTPRVMVFTPHHQAPAFSFSASGLTTSAITGSLTTSTASNGEAAGCEEGEGVGSGDGEAVLNERKRSRAPPWPPGQSNSPIAPRAARPGSVGGAWAWQCQAAASLHSGTGAAAKAQPQAPELGAVKRVKSREGDVDPERDQQQQLPLGRTGHTAPAAHHAPLVKEGSHVQGAAAALAAGDEQGDEGEGEEEGSVVLPAAEFCRLHSVQVTDPAARGTGGAALPALAPVQRFEDAAFQPFIQQALASAGFPRPSVIQSMAWPLAMAGRDMVAIASTGSGKTLAFLLPALEHIKASGNDPVKGPTALVLAPTRELAQQILTEARRFAALWPDASGGGGSGSNRYGRSHRRPPGSGLRTACLYGGASRGGQGRELAQRPQLVIATPGRLLDFVESGELNLSQVTYLVLDEADRMLDMGFEPQIKDILRNLPAERQTLFFSATWPREVQRVAQRFAANEPVSIFIGDVQAKPVAAASIRQHVRVLHGAEEKFEALKEHLKQLQEASSSPDSLRVIVFVATKSAVDELAHRITYEVGIRAASLHGDKTQAAREFALAKFRQGRVPVLVATDVAARGLDVANVTSVVNYSLPKDLDMYVHRIGRTGRGGASGESLALVTPADRGGVQPLIQILEGAGQEVPDELRRLAQRHSGAGGSSSRWGGRGRDSHRQGGSWGGRGGGHGGRRGGDWHDDERRQSRWGGARGGGEDHHGDDGGEDHTHRRQHHHADRSDWRSGYGKPERKRVQHSG